MMKLVLLIVALIGMANAFAPSALRRSTSNMRSVSMYAGQQVGNEFDALSEKVKNKPAPAKTTAKTAAPAPAKKAAPAKKVEKAAPTDGVRFEVKLPTEEKKAAPISSEATVLKKKSEYSCRASK